MNGNPRILLRESIDGDQYQTGRHLLAGSDPQFPRRRIGEEFDVLDALPQLVEHGDAAFDERVWRGGGGRWGGWAGAWRRVQFGRARPRCVGRRVAWS